MEHPAKHIVLPQILSSPSVDLYTSSIIRMSDLFDFLQARELLCTAGLNTYDPTVETPSPLNRHFADHQKLFRITKGRGAVGPDEQRITTTEAIQFMAEDKDRGWTTMKDSMVSTLVTPTFTSLISLPEYLEHFETLQNKDVEQYRHSKSLPRAVRDVLNSSYIPRFGSMFANLPQLAIRFTEWQVEHSFDLMLENRTFYTTEVVVPVDPSSPLECPFRTAQTPLTLWYDTVLKNKDSPADFFKLFGVVEKEETIGVFNTLVSMIENSKSLHRPESEQWLENVQAWLSMFNRTYSLYTPPGGSLVEKVRQHSCGDELVRSLMMQHAVKDTALWAIYLDSSYEMYLKQAQEHMLTPLPISLSGHVNAGLLVKRLVEVYRDRGIISTVGGRRWCNERIEQVDLEDDLIGLRGLPMPDDSKLGNIVFPVPSEKGSVRVTKYMYLALSTKPLGEGYFPVQMLPTTGQDFCGIASKLPIHTTVFDSATVFENFKGDRLRDMDAYGMVDIKKLFLEVELLRKYAVLRGEEGLLKAMDADPITGDDIIVCFPHTVQFSMSMDTALASTMYHAYRSEKPIQIRKDSEHGGVRQAFFNNVTFLSEESSLSSHENIVVSGGAKQARDIPDLERLVISELPGMLKERKINYTASEWVEAKIIHDSDVFSQPSEDFVTRNTEFSNSRGSLLLTTFLSGSYEGYCSSIRESVFHDGQLVLLTCPGSWMADPQSPPVSPYYRPLDPCELITMVRLNGEKSYHPPVEVHVIELALGLLQAEKEARGSDADSTFTDALITALWMLTFATKSINTETQYVHRQVAFHKMFLS
jgi:hypothetical protein